MDLDLDQMRSVVVLAEHLHFGRAAAALCVSQPALTKQIHKIEDILGGPLFVRRPRQLTLTQAGRVLIEHARVLLRDGQLAIDVSRSAMRGEAGLLRIGFGLPSLATGLPDLIQRFRIRFPRVQISMNEMSTPPQLDALGNRTLDVGFVRLPIPASEISSFPLFTDRLVIAVGANSAKDLRKGLRSFARESFILVSRSASASLHDHILRTCHAAGFLPPRCPRSKSNTKELGWRQRFPHLTTRLLQRSHLQLPFAMSMNSPRTTGSSSADSCHS